LLATGDDFGQVKLFKYPCVKEKADFNDYYGHSSHVTKVKFSADDKLVFSTGGGDKTVMVWSTDVNPNDDVFSGGADEESDGEEPEQENRLENARELRQVEK
jgi:microtubule-associated protein-like 6